MSNPRPVAFSYSRLKTFEKCPKEYYHSFIQKDVPKPKGPEIDYGTEVHKVLEKRIQHKRPLPKGLSWLERYAARFDDFDGTVLVEQQMAVNFDLEPCEWFDRKTYCRAIADVVAISRDGRKAVAIDWKTGKKLEDQDQMDILAFVLFQHYPDLEEAKLCYGWLKERDFTTYTLDREEASGAFTAIVPRVRQIAKAHATTDFPPKPNGTCLRWCPVTSCPHNGKSAGR